MADYHSTEICIQPNFGFTIQKKLPAVFPGKSIVRPAAVILLFGFLTGCALSGPKTAQFADDASVITSSVAKPTEVAGIQSTDAEVIKSVVADARINPQSSLALAWVNPDTGSSGTITTIDNFLGKHGQKCRGFKTTVSTFMGVAFYNGETCQISPSEWVLSWFKRSDS